jgi:hypothetical protein
MILAFLAFAAIALLPGYGLAAALRLNLTWFERLVIGSILGLSILGVGGALASATQLEWTRWIPTGLATATWIGFRRAAPMKDSHGSRLVLPLLGAFGVLVTLPNTLEVLGSQPVTWHGRWSFYGDLPFQIALVGATGFRPASHFPWAIDTPSHYTWLFHAALGAWGQASHLTEASMVLRVWPIAYGILLPTMVAVLTLRVTKKPWAAAFTVLVVPFVRMGESLFAKKAKGLQYSISPTFEFGVLVTLSLVTLFIVAMPQMANRISLKRDWYLLAITGVVVFANSGSKGSTWFVTIGAIGALWLVVLIRTKVFNTLATYLLLVVLGAGLLANLTVVKTVAGTHVDPTHEFRGLSLGQLSLTVASIAIIFATVGYSLLLPKSGKSGAAVSVDRFLDGAWLSRVTLGGAAVAGLISMLVLAHPDNSQTYFWYSAFIFWIILCCETLTSIFRIDPFGVLAVASTVRASLFLIQYRHHHGKLFSAVLAFTLILTVITAIYFVTKRKRSAEAKAQMPLSVAAYAMVAMISLIPLKGSLQPLSFQEDTGSRQHELAVSRNQLDAMQFIQSQTKSTDLVATNQYCPDRDRTDSNCAVNQIKANPWFLTSAFASRDVLFESNGYSWQLAEARAAGTVRSANYTLNDSFMRHPSNQTARQMRAKGVRYFYVNTRFAHADTYQPFAALVWHRSHDQVWKLAAK